MSLLVRSCRRAITHTPRIVVNARGAHKKAAIQVKLHDYVEGVGIKDEVVTVRPGLMRNVLYPAGQASYIESYQGARNRVREETGATPEDTSAAAAHAEKRRVMANQLLGGLEGVGDLVFKRAVVPESTNTFGSVTADDLANQLNEEYGLVVDKTMIEFKSEGGRIKSLGDHMVKIQIGQQSALIKVVVKAA
ncbi:hypothetical protein EC973_006960 [Apophysomyces ossiformis]|uniref:50S ribosomal protein L9, chloroplastic n=1 Tax=Apophysomyces ossiformis TaxID=679940 RepID=A0A8H7EUE5_9FUNG|nr:hypothetical protein EC973_006960 [Apophysomyces ossiformis]